MAAMAVKLAAGQVAEASDDGGGDGGEGDGGHPDPARERSAATRARMAPAAVTAVTAVTEVMVAVAQNSRRRGRVAAMTVGSVRSSPHNSRSQWRW